VAVGIAIGCGCIFLLIELGVWAKLGILARNAVKGMLILCSLGVSYLVIERMWRHKLLVAVRQILNERGIATCVCCGYDLRQIQSERCPECGVPRSRAAAGDHEAGTEMPQDP